MKKKTVDMREVQLTKVIPQNTLKRFRNLYSLVSIYPYKHIFLYLEAVIIQSFDTREWKN